MKTESPQGWTDVTIPVTSGMIAWPGDTVLTMEKTMDIDSGDEVNVSRIVMSSHCGTHMDAPAHYIRGGRGIDRLPLDSLTGPARIIEVMDSDCIRPEDIAALNIGQGERLLFRTRNSLNKWWGKAFKEDFVHLTADTARLLVEKKVKLVGVDYLSVGAYEKENGTIVHKTLLGAGVCIVEGLDLTQVEAGKCEFICLPLRIENGDGSPVRALVRML